MSSSSSQSGRGPGAGKTPATSSSEERARRKAQKSHPRATALDQPAAAQGRAAAAAAAAAREQPAEVPQPWRSVAAPERVVQVQAKEPGWRPPPKQVARNETPPHYIPLGRSPLSWQPLRKADFPITQTRHPQAQEHPPRARTRLPEPERHHLGPDHNGEIESLILDVLSSTGGVDGVTRDLQRLRSDEPAQSMILQAIPRDYHERILLKCYEEKSRALRHLRAELIASRDSPGYDQGLAARESVFFQGGVNGLEEELARLRSGVRVQDPDLRRSDCADEEVKLQLYYIAKQKDFYRLLDKLGVLNAGAVVDAAKRLASRAGHGGAGPSGTHT